MPSCSIINCFNTTKRGQNNNGDISFHRFPTDPEIKQKWIDATGRKNWFPSKHSRICSIHFHESTFSGTSKYRRVISSGYPTISIMKMETEKQVDFGHHNYLNSYLTKIPDSQTAEDPESESEQDEVLALVVKEEPEDTDYEPKKQEGAEALKPKLDVTKKKDPLLLFEEPDSEIEVDTIVIKEEPEDTDYESKKQETQEAKKPKLDVTVKKDSLLLLEDSVERMPPTTDWTNVTIKKKVYVPLEPQATCSKTDCGTSNDDTVLIPQSFIMNMHKAQSDILNTMKSQVLMQNPDAELLTFLRFLGAKLQMLPEAKRKEIQDTVTALVLEEYFGG